MAVARSSVFFDCRPQKVSMPRPRCARSAGVSLSELGTRRCDSRNPSAPRLPTALRIRSANTGVYSTQCPSPSMTGCLRCLRISSGVRCALIWLLQKKTAMTQAYVRHRLCPTIVDVKPPAASVHPERRDSDTVEGRTALHTAAPSRLRPRSPVPAPLRLIVIATSTMCDVAIPERPHDLPGAAYSLRVSPTLWRPGSKL